jgi:hypothetical protein
MALLARVAQAEHGREAILPRRGIAQTIARQEPERLQHVDRDLHRGVRRDVAEALGERGATLLLEQAGDTTGLDRLVEVALRVLTVRIVPRMTRSPTVIV